MKEYFLEELLQIKNGKDHKHLNDGNIPVFGSGGIMRYGNQAIYNDESILLPRKGTLTNIQFVNKPFWTVDTIYYTIINKEKSNPLYLYHYLKQLDLSYLNSGTGVPSMTFGAYYQVKVNLPSLDIQQKIAKVLSDLDTKIELNNSINSELEAMAKTLYDYWFVQFDFPDGNGKPYKSSGGKMVWNEELNREIPEGWENIKLQDLCHKIGDGIHGTPKYVEKSEYSFINGNNLKNGFIQTDNETKKVSLEEYEKYFIPLNENSILLSINGTLGNLAVFTGEKVMLGKSSAYINCKENNRAYCYQFLKQEHMPSLFWNIATGSTIKNLSLDSIKKLKILKPNNNLIEHFHLKTKAIDDKRKNIFIENQELASLRDWLLPMLMNGQVTVDDVEEELGMVAEETEIYRK